MRPSGRPHEERGFCSVDCQREYMESLDRSALLRLMERTESSSGGQASTANSAADRPAAVQIQQVGSTNQSGGPIQAITATRPLFIEELWRFPPAPSVPGPFFEECARLRFALIPEVPLGAPATTRVPPKAVPKRPVTPARSPATPPRPTPSTIARPAPAIPATPPQTKAEVPAQASIDVAIGHDLEPGTDNKRMKLVLGGLTAVAVLVFLFFGLLPRGDNAAVGSEVASAPRPETWQPVPVSLGEDRPVFLFEPSLSWVDYRAESRVNRYIGLAWAYRAQNNMAYVMELAPGRYRSAMVLTRYSITNGERSRPIVVDVPVSPDEDVILVQLETERTSYRLFLEGQLAAKWVQAGLGDGGFGIVGTSEAVDWNAVKVAEVTRGSAARETSSRIAR